MATSGGDGKMVCDSELLNRISEHNFFVGNSLLM